MTIVEDKDIRTIPWCTIILVALALTCHTLVLLGNLLTAQMFSEIGDSTIGWGSVGLSLSGSMNKELDTAMSETVDFLTDGLQQVVFLQQGIDLLLGLVSNSTDEAASLLQDPRMKTHPLMMAESPSHEKYRSLLAIGSETYNSRKVKKVELKRVRRGVSQLYFGEIPHDGKVGFHEDAASFMQTDLVAGGNATKGSMLIWTAENAIPVNTKVVKGTLKEEVEDLTDKVKELASDFLEAIQPALLQVGKWLQSMGEKMLATIEQFSMTIDRVQKIFDQIMQQINGPSIPVELIVHNTFTLFDLSNSGTVDLSELEEVGSIYGITALAGDKAEVLFNRYDTDNSGELTTEEYTNLILDDDIPSAGTYVLRQFSKKLSQVGGNVAAAGLREEVAEAVVDYLTLMAVKNRTKVAWICNSLTNQSLVPDVTATVIKVLAENSLDPVPVTTVNVAQVTVDELLLQEPEYAMECYDLMCDPDWWVSQGFDSYKQPQLISIAAEWFANSPNAPTSSLLQKKNSSFYSSLVQKTGLILNQVGSEIGGEKAAEFSKSMGELAFKEVYKRKKRYEAKGRQERIAFQRSVFSSPRAQTLFTNLLGTASFVSDLGVPDADVTAALNSGVPALPETLEFAKFLSWNATQTAKRFEGYAFDYASTSSNALESFANQVKGMVNKVSGFMNTMMEYSTPRGIKELEQSIQDFIDGAADAANEAVDKMLDEGFDKADEVFDNVVAKGSEVASGAMNKVGLGLVQINGKQSPVDDVTEKVEEVAGEVEDAAASVFSEVNELLTTFKSILPTVIEDLKFARTEVSSVAQVLETVFSNLGAKGSPIFQLVASLYGTLWRVYYVFFALMTCTLLFYGFWASGWFGGPIVKEEDSPPPPTSFKERCLRCCRACNWCMHTCHNTHLCFWSCMLFAEVIILVMFIVSIVLAILSGVKVFINVGCAQIYVLGDDTVCTSTMQMLQKWLSTFWLSEKTDVLSACSQETLIACKKIMEDMLKSAIFTTVGSFAAALFSFQMLFESASLHEKARWTYLAELAMGDK